jgi:RimJ/RimL family protein N-acetyltransferase
VLRSNSNDEVKVKMIGTVGTVRVPQGLEDAVEVAYGIHSDFWGQGYASEAMGMFVALYCADGSKTSASSHVCLLRGTFADE